MKALIQRVQEASVLIDSSVFSHIDKGLLVFVGITDTDSQSQLNYITKKILELRIFEDEDRKMNRCIMDINGQLLVVSQFTLYANCARGRRPDFIKAARPDFAIPLYEEFIRVLKNSGLLVKTGIFGADMKIQLINDGPVTIILDKE